MKKVKEEQLVGFIKSHLGERKLLDEWRLELNETVGRCNRLTMSELSSRFSVLKSKGIFNVEKGSRCYSFSL